MKSSFYFQAAQAAAFASAHYGGYESSHATHHAQQLAYQSQAALADLAAAQQAANKAYSAA
jgi:hypothetical protein